LQVPNIRLTVRLAMNILQPSEDAYLGPLALLDSVLIRFWFPKS
jgi:hypothetical protein